MALFGSTPGDNRRPGPRPFSGRESATRTPASRQPTIGRRNTVAPFSAVPEPPTSPAPRHASEPKETPAAPPEASSPDGVYQALEPTSALNVGDLRPDTVEHAYSFDELAHGKYPVEAEAAPFDEGHREEPEAAPSIESMAPDTELLWPEPESIAPEPESLWPEPESIAAEPESLWSEPEVADAGLVAEVQGTELPDAVEEPVVEAFQPSEGEGNTVPDEWWATEPASPEGTTGGVEAWGEDSSTFSSDANQQPHVASTGELPASPDTEQVLDALEAVARMVRSREIVVSVGAGASAESVLASILASLLSHPS